MSSADTLDLLLCLAAITSTVALASLAHNVLMRAFGLSELEPRYRFADHPDAYRAWTQQQRPVMGGLTPTRADRRRNEAIAARTGTP